MVGKIIHLLCLSTIGCKSYCAGYDMPAARRVKYRQMPFFQMILMSIIMAMFRAMMMENPARSSFFISGRLPEKK